MADVLSENAFTTLLAFFPGVNIHSHPFNVTVRTARQLLDFHYCQRETYSRETWSRGQEKNFEERPETASWLLLCAIDTSTQTLKVNSTLKETI